jgi:glucose/arabinose dehydrogenase
LPTTFSALNQIVFGQNGELYINVGSNTNGGLPGKSSRSGQLIESFYSASNVVARLASPGFNGAIQYDALTDGNPFNSVGVEVFAPGLRNPFGLVLHSNGYLYAADNGPNYTYGKFEHVVFVSGCVPLTILLLDFKSIVSYPIANI